MSEIRVNGARLFYEVRGDGEETILFSHGLLWNTALFRPQVDALAKRYRCVAYDHRGQGKSELPASGDEVSIETCTEDAIALIEALDLTPCHFVGLSMGGFVGMRIAARRPELLRSLTLMETAADPEPSWNVPKYRLLNFAARYLGIGVVVGRVAPIMLGKSVLEDPALSSIKVSAEAELAGNGRGIYKAVNGVIRREGCEDELAGIELPTCILHGEEDAAISMERARRLHVAIPHARFATIPRAGHSSTVENPEAVNRELAEFLASV